ncbi:hypothetical protein F5Y17DRAFT_453930 [Xylariaceae sp. FL0594]|nr:hypothetical protein F5Y17DRAFT_453930 [Xylariaceae sp. FL0594]
MSSRVLKVKERNTPIAVLKSNQRVALASLVDDSGVGAMPCARCFKRSLKCIVSPESTRCKECILAKRPCDGPGVTIESANKIISERDRIDREEEETEERLEQVRKEYLLARQRLDDEQQRLDAELAHLSRLRKQKRFLKKRASEMISRGSQSLEEYEDEIQESPPSSPPPINDFDWSGVDLGSPSWLGDLGSTAWVGQGVVGETVQQSPGHAQGAS